MLVLKKMSKEYVLIVYSIDAVVDTIAFLFTDAYHTLALIASAPFDAFFYHLTIMYPSGNMRRMFRFMRQQRTLCADRLARNIDDLHG